MKNDLKFVFVHGLGGWGSYEAVNRIMPYWGMRTGDLTRQLKEKGFDCYSASVGSHASAYDRACELYGQLTGRVTDYGEHHSIKYGHGRYGRDFRNRPLIENFSRDSRLVLIGHSFGGATIRRFAHMMEHGSADNQTENCSDFFKGGAAGNIFALVAIAAPHNGATAFSLPDDIDERYEHVRAGLKERIMARFMDLDDKAQKPAVEEDSAEYEMQIDNALRINKSLLLSEDIYYFSQPCQITCKKSDGTRIPIEKETEAALLKTARRIGAYTGVTREGHVIDESWLDSDGLVNTVSATYPIGNEHKPFDHKNIEKGIWNVFETYHGDHLALLGGLLKKKTVLPYYEKLLAMISELSSDS